MARITTCTILLTFVVLATAVPASAAPGTGCAVLDQPSEQAECRARQEAREAARAEVARAVADDAPADGARAGEPARTAAWQRALDEADGPHLDEIVAPRPIAAIGGLLWFAFAVRARRRASRRAARRS